MKELEVNCNGCNCGYFSLRIDVDNCEIKLSCEMCSRTVVLSTDTSSIKMLQRQEQEKQGDRQG